MRPLEELATRLSLPIENDLRSYRASPAFIRQFPISYVREHQIIGFHSTNENSIRLASSDEKAWAQLDVVSRKLRSAVRPLLAPPEQIRLAINAAYSVRDGEAEQVLESIGLKIAGEKCRESGIEFAEFDGDWRAYFAVTSEVLLCGSAFGIAGVSRLNAIEFPWPGPVLMALEKVWWS